MIERYDLDQMIAEIKEDEKRVHGDKDARVSQDDILKMLRERRKNREARRRDGEKEAAK
ncbi:MAG: hypothetical protein ACLFOY_03570 [Desulfatibacillaceae bacterium]